MIKKLFAGVAFGALSLVFVACGDSSSNSGSTAGGTCSAYAITTCGYLTRCFAISDPNCAATVEQVCATAMSAPGSGVNAGMLSNCGAKFAAAACGSNPTCETPAGTLPVGAGCYSDVQCASRECTASTSTTCGVCAALPRVGESCVDRCEADATCVTAPMGQRSCVKRPVVGEPCDVGGTSCADGLLCESGKCAPIPSLGQACSIGCAGASCVNKLCVADAELGQACGPSPAPSCNRLKDLTCENAVCVPKKKAAVGEPCGVVGASFVDCVDNAQCRLQGMAGAGLCVATLPYGAACVTTGADDACASPSGFALRCVEGRCAPPPPPVCQ